MANSDTTYKNPILWVPTSYMAMGFVLSAITLSTNFAFKNLNLPNGTNTLLAAILTLPYVLKPLWAPLLELYRTKKFWVLSTQVAIALMMGLAGLSLQLPFWLSACFAALMLAAIMGATQDIGSDGIYVTTLNAKQQATFAGVQSMAWTMGPLIAAGALVPLAGYLHKTFSLNWETTWMYVFCMAGGFIALLAVWHWAMLPTGGRGAEAPSNAGEAFATFGDAFRTFFKKKAVWRLIAVAYFYRFGIYLLEKVGNIFLIADRGDGGLGLTNEAAGVIIGVWGAGAMLLASVLGGLFVARTGLNKKILLILCICINVPNLTFLYLSYALPDPETGYWLITATIFIEKFGYGFGAVGHMLYMMQQIAPGKYKTAYYAFATGFMGLCNVSTAAISGWLQELIGYQTFFVVVLFAAAPAIAAVLFAPFDHDTGGSSQEPEEGSTEAPAGAA